MAGSPVIERIELTRHASVRDGIDEYAPIRRIGDWWCWPVAPDELQLTSGEAYRESLARGSDFDKVVLAIPVGALGRICGELAGANPRFKMMLERVQTVRTRGLQLWLTKPIDELCAGGPSGLDPPATGYAEPFDTYCDMSHLLTAEAYDGIDGPKAIAYFCGVLPDAVAAPEAEASVRASAREYLERQIGRIWPGAMKEGKFDWEVLFDPEQRQGSDRLQAQYCRANVPGTDRYVTTFAGTVDARLEPGHSGFENLVLAGDWTHNGIDGGCVEAAVVSGERAAEALITRRPHHRRGGNDPAPYVEYGAFATAPGPLRCERARLYCFVLRADRARVQQLCDRVLKEPTGGALRYVVPRLAPLILSFGTIAGLRSLHPDHADRGSASEPEAAIWVPTIAQRYASGRYVDQHLAVFMPYLWVDDPIAFASGREVYGFAKTQGWMKRLDDPRDGSGDRPPDPPESMALDVYGTAQYGASSQLGRQRLITIRRRSASRGGPERQDSSATAEGDDLQSLLAMVMSEVEGSPDVAIFGPASRSAGVGPGVAAAVRARGAAWGELLSRQVVRHVFLKQIRDAERGELAVLQQVVEARSSVDAGSLRWRRLRGTYGLSVERLDTHPLEDELGLAGDQTVHLAFVSEFGFRMEPGVVKWPP
jgi:hypothetical protein